ncbi:MAG TPA: hypothetical protein VJ385_02770 [Fibrobacteria bacterium]|nr:hypothetical protein [Fibrobacteria bacterium]
MKATFAGGRPAGRNGRSATRNAGPILPALLGLACLGSAWGKVAVSVLGAYVEGRDSAYHDGLSRDLGQALAEDTSLLVFDLRKKNAAALDSAHALGTLAQASLLVPMNGNQVKWGLVVECAELKEEYRCRLEAVDMFAIETRVLDTLYVLLEAGEKRKQFAQAAARPFAAALLPKKAETPAVGTLKLKVPANPATLIRGLAVIRRGSIAEVPLGTTLVIGDSPRLIVVSMENVHYVLYPHSSYTYMLPKVVQLNQGTLGIIKGVDSASVEGKLRQATALDESNLIWKTLTKVAALDSSNLLWQGLGKVTALDSHNLILRNLQKVTAMDTNNLLFKTFGKVTALDSNNLLLRTLTQVAAMDSSNLVWKGLGQVSSLDSGNLIWKKLGEIASLDSNSIWRKLGLLAFQDNSVVLTPSFIVRGQPQAVLFRHEGSVSTMEVVKGSMSAQPLLSSQDAAGIGAMRTVRTRGYSLKQERLNPARADRILREFETVDPNRGSRPFAMFLPGKLFGTGSALRTADKSMQSFIVSGSREMDMEMDVLSSEKEGWSEFGGTFRSGAQESGCYLCSPDRLGP